MRRRLPNDSCASLSSRPSSRFSRYCFRNTSIVITNMAASVAPMRNSLTSAGARLSSSENNASNGMVARAITPNRAGHTLARIPDSPAGNFSSFSLAVVSPAAQNKTMEIASGRS